MEFERLNEIQDRVSVPRAVVEKEKWDFLRDEIFKWWTERDFEFPWREPAPEWQKLVSEILLQRTHANSVENVHTNFFDTFPTPEALAEADREEIAEIIKPLGLAWRAKYLSQLGDELAELSGEVPTERENIEELPGIGQYAAGAFLTFSRLETVTFIDANIVKLLGRYFGFDWDGETRRKKWFRELAETFFNHNHPPDEFGYAVLDFTREICGRSPNCGKCPVQTECDLGRMNYKGSNGEP
jgi:A/G-specific adenine glycosylase